MSLQALLDRYAPGRPTVVTVGTFDGVHAGHRNLLSKVVELARDPGGERVGVAITFRRQPRAFLHPGERVSYLCTLDERLALVNEIGIDVVIPIDFDETLQSLSPREFMGFLRERLRMSDFVSGPGAAVGRDRRGDAEMLQALGNELGFGLHRVQPACYRGTVVSSTAIRDALAAGRMADVAGMLGRNFRLRGRVQRGDGRGRKLGFPTANIAPGEPGMPAALPGDGIYAGWAHLADGARYMAATSIGVRPTFGEGSRTVEAYLVDFDGDLYGKTMTLEFVSRLRDERKFDDAEALVSQMKRDVSQARESLKAARSAEQKKASP